MQKCHLVSFRHAKIVGSLVHPDRRTLHICLYRVHHLSLHHHNFLQVYPGYHLVVDHGGKVFENLVDVPNVRFKLGNASLPLLQILKVLLLLKHQLFWDNM